MSKSFFDWLSVSLLTLTRRCSGSELKMRLGGIFQSKVWPNVAFFTWGIDRELYIPYEERWVKWELLDID